MKVIFGKNNFFDFIIKFCILIFVFCLILWSVVFRAVTQAEQAKFVVDAMQRYTEIYENKYQQQIKNIYDFPDVEIVSPDGGICLKSKDLKQGVVMGYIYYIESYDEGKYVISASPVGFLNTKMEYGITDEGVLKENKDNVDMDPDKYEEVRCWDSIDREVGIDIKI